MKYLKLTDKIFWIAMTSIFAFAVSIVYHEWNREKQETYEVKAIFVRDNCVVYRLTNNGRDLFYYADCERSNLEKR